MQVPLMPTDPPEGELPLDSYRKAMHELPLVTVDILFFNPEKTKTLLGKRVREPYARIWYAFGGRLHKNEEFADAALRIGKKECGLVLKAENIMQAGVLNEISPNSIFEGVNYHSVDIYFGCIIEEQPVVLDDQHSEARWFDVNDPTLHPNVQKRIAGALGAL